MARKKIIDKSKPEEEVQAEVAKDEAKPKKKTTKATNKAKALETPKDNSGKPEEDIDAFDIDTVPAAGADMLRPEPGRSRRFGSGSPHPEDS